MATAILIVLFLILVELIIFALTIQNEVKNITRILLDGEPITVKEGFEAKVAEVTNEKPGLYRFNTNTRKMELWSPDE